MTDPADLRERFEARFGYWHEAYDTLLEMDPTFLERYLALAGRPHESDVLDAATSELVELAVNASVTHLHPPAIRRHVEGALDAGATPEEVLEVFELVSAVGIHSLIDGVPVLVEEGGEPPAPDAAEREAQDAAKADFRERRGYWSEIWESVLALDREFFEAYTDFSGHPYQEGPLDPKVKEFVYVAMDVSTTHLYAPGLRVHIRNALAYGATHAEVMAVIEHACGLGMGTMEVGLPILADVLAEREAGGG
jgi:alkylhydroperoxidase/carboxymuconolactone decarboxylase family protein YurZ